MRKRIIAVVLFISVFIACNRKSTPKEEYTQGVTTIIADETFKPIIEDELLVFRDNYPKAHIKPLYRPENELLNMFLNDSVRIAIMSRMLSDREKKIFEN